MAPPKQKPGKSKQDYQTPKEFLEKVKKRFQIKDFSIDLAASCDNTVASKYYTITDNALTQPWCVNGIAWCNPPYDNITPWVKKAYNESRPDKYQKILMLLPASVGSNWFRDFVFEKAPVLFLNGRLAFMKDHPTWLYPKDTMLLEWGYQKECCGQWFSLWDWRK